MNIKFKIGIILVLLMATLAMQNTATAQLKAETAEQKAKRMEWWTDARFGMFIHWGLYALPARHEWVKNAERMSSIKSISKSSIRIFTIQKNGPEWLRRQG